MNSLLLQITLSSGPSLQLVQGDITAETTDAIVNAANERLKHGAGVAGAISRRGGPTIQAESDAWVRKHGPVRHAAPAWTSGGKLFCRYVIHAVGPIWDETPGEDITGNADAGLQAAVTGSLRVADELGLESIALPAISTGIFGFPNERAARILLKAVQGYFEIMSNSGIKIIRLVLLEASSISAFHISWHDHFNP